MTRYGNPTSLYLQDGLLPKINQVLEGFSDIFKSRNHFINCAIVRELRRINENVEREKN